MSNHILRGFAAAAVIATTAAGSVTAQTVGEPAPDFQATILDGGKVSLADFRGQVLVVNLWATWCGPCKRELPLLDAYYRAQKKAGLRVIALTTEDSLPPEALRPLAKIMAIPVVRYMKAGRFLHPAYAQRDGVPTNYVIDRKGVVRYAEAGAFTLDGLNEVLVPLLREPVPETGAAAPAAQTASR
jgi:cytochrome c biogenesis protein CcmG/thiol:disulfide interchange protein DsbE